MYTDRQLPKTAGEIASEYSLDPVELQCYSCGGNEQLSSFDTVCIGNEQWPGVIRHHVNCHYDAEVVLEFTVKCR